MPPTGVAAGASLVETLVSAGAAPAAAVSVSVAELLVESALVEEVSEDDGASDDEDDSEVDVEDDDFVDVLEVFLVEVDFEVLVAFSTYVDRVLPFWPL
jgi:hypothetical protein